jgi:serine/threonine-protein kinase HipA
VNQVFVPSYEPFSGLYGVFHDSLPDGWGALLVDRMLRREGINPIDVSPLVRLAIVGSAGRGALSYRPELSFPHSFRGRDLDQLNTWCQELLADHPVSDLDEVFAAGGSSGGARPKAYVKDEQGEWLVKFPSRLDPEDIGLQEYAYMRCAEECGIQVPPYRLLSSQTCSGFFATKRFDRTEDGGRLHMLSASGVVEVSHRVPALDYESLFQISYMLVSDRAEAEQLFRRMCFNVFACNRDDHSNNFSWLCREGAWALSPAYDLTYSDGMGGEHATSVLGNGRPGMDDVLELAEEAGFSRRRAQVIARDIQARCWELLRETGNLGS